MSKLVKGIAVLGVIAAGAAICVTCPAVGAAVTRVAVLTAPSVCEIIDECGHWPLY